MRQSSGSRASVAKTRFSPAVLDAGNVSGIISAMASGNAICLVNVEQQRPALSSSDNHLVASRRGDDRLARRSWLDNLPEIRADTGEDFAGPRARDNCGEVDWGLPAAHPGWPRGSSSRWGLAASRPRSSVTRAKPLSTEQGTEGHGIDAPEHFSCAPDNCRNRCGAEVFGLVPIPDPRRPRIESQPNEAPPAQPSIQTEPS